MNTTTTPRLEGQAEEPTYTPTDADADVVALYKLLSPEAQTIYQRISKRHYEAYRSLRLATRLATSQAAAAGEAPDWPEAAAGEIYPRPATEWSEGEQRAHQASVARIAAIIRKHSLAGQLGKGAEREQPDRALMQEMADALATIDKQTQRVNEGRIDAYSQVGTIALSQCKRVYQRYLAWRKKPKLRPIDASPASLAK